MCTRSASACAPQCGRTAQCAPLIAPYGDCAIHTRSAAVQPTQFPCIEYVFRFLEGERFVPDGIFDVDVSVEAVPELCSSRLKNSFDASSRKRALRSDSLSCIV